MGIDCVLSCTIEGTFQPLSLFNICKKTVFEDIIVDASKGAYPCKEQPYWENTAPHILEMCQKLFHDYGEEEVYRPIYGPIVYEMEMDCFSEPKKLDIPEQFPMGGKVELWDSRANSFCPNAVPNVSADTLHDSCANGNPNIWEYEVQNEEDCEYINDWFIELSKQSNYHTLYYLPPSWTGVLHFECVIS